MSLLKSDGGSHAPPNPIAWPACHTPRAATGRSTQDVEAVGVPWPRDDPEHPPRLLRRRTAPPSATTPPKRQDRSARAVRSPTSQTSLQGPSTIPTSDARSGMPPASGAGRPRIGFGRTKPELGLHERDALRAKSARRPIAAPFGALVGTPTLRRTAHWVNVC